MLADSTVLLTTMVHWQCRMEAKSATKYNVILSFCKLSRDDLFTLKLIERGCGLYTLISVGTVLTWRR